MCESGDVPRPEQISLDEPVHARGRGVVPRTGGAHDRVGGQVDARPLDLTEIELADAVGVDDLGLDVEPALGVAELLDVIRRASGSGRTRRQQSRAGVGGDRSRRQKPTSATSGTRPPSAPIVQASAE